MLSALGCAEAVAVDVLKGALSRVGRSKVRAVAAEHCDPLGARLVDGVGDEVGGVVVAAPGHTDVRRGRAGRIADQKMRGLDGVAWAPWTVVAYASSTCFRT